MKRPLRFGMHQPERRAAMRLRGRVTAILRSAQKKTED